MLSVLNDFGRSDDAGPRDFDPPGSPPEELHGCWVEPDSPGAGRGGGLQWPPQHPPRSLLARQRSGRETGVARWTHGCKITLHRCSHPLGPLVTISSAPVDVNARVERHLAAAVNRRPQPVLIIVLIFPDSFPRPLTELLTLSSKNTCTTMVGRRARGLVCRWAWPGVDFVAASLALRSAANRMG